MTREIYLFSSNINIQRPTILGNYKPGERHKINEHINYIIGDAYKKLEMRVI